MDIETMIFLGIIVGILLIIGIKKIFIDNGKTNRSSYHYSKPPLYNIEPSISKSTDSQQNVQNNHADIFSSSVKLSKYLILIILSGTGFLYPV